ncbi:MAG TPA: hypothetical protein P5060_02540 [Candidatus Absconditabacterales bacterium]|nr:hypothetical protein [Candidatus Absconditabacterales bacterium]
MKKLLTILFFVLFIGGVFGTSIELQQTTSIEQNVGSTILPTLTVDFSGTIQDSFTINLGNDKLIFLESYDGDLDYTISDDHKKITFDENEDEIVTIDGLKVRTYDDTVNNARIGLDIDNDGIVDYETIRYIEVTSDENTDNDKPLPVKDLSYDIDGRDLILSWTKSPSLDVVRQVVRITKNGNFYMDKYITAGEESITLEDYDPQENTYNIEVYAKDFYYAGVPTSIDINEIEEIENDIEETPKYTPTTDSYVVTTIATYIDTLIDENYTEVSIERNKVIEYRNDFIVILEDFVNKTISKTEAQTKFVESLSKLMPLIK